MFTMMSLHRFLSAAAILLLVTSAEGRTLGDPTLTSRSQDDVMPDGLDPNDDPDTLADLWKWLVTSRHAQPYAPWVASGGSAKRAWPGRYGVPSSMKRKMFWTPLGHLPASARLGRPPNLRPDMEDSGSPVFRYG
ncbi:hypothetical protein ACOMHN_055900 [Nucella lapillus]